MKELRLFYVPALTAEHDGATVDLPSEEAQHALRVLRMKAGDALCLTNGRGLLADAVVEEAAKQTLTARIERLRTFPRICEADVLVAVAPTKHADRLEWFLEKAAEIGLPHIALLMTKNVERTRVNMDRLRKILISAMKQSHSAWLTVLDEPRTLRQLLGEVEADGKYIAYCEEGSDGWSLSAQNLLRDVHRGGENAVVLIGPEGDFTEEEVRQARAAGFQCVSLGTARLRTETAALVAAFHLVQ